MVNREGLFRSSRTRSICLSTLLADSKTEPMLPRPPASETAATSSGAVAGQIAACMMGTSMSRRSHIGVRNTALSFLTFPVAAARLLRSIALRRSRRIAPVCYRFTKYSISTAALFGATGYCALLIPTTIESRVTRCWT